MSAYPSYPPAAPPSKTSGLAIASLVTSILGLSLIAVITGHIAKKQIRESMGALTGDGLATAGLIIGYIGLAIGVCACIIMIVYFGSIMAYLGVYGY